MSFFDDRRWNNIKQILPSIPIQNFVFFVLNQEIVQFVEILINQIGKKSFFKQFAKTVNFLEFILYEQITIIYIIIFKERPNQFRKKQFFFKFHLMATVNQILVKYQSFLLKNKKSKENETNLVTFKNQNIKKFTHKKGSQSCLTDYSKINESQTVISAQTIPIQSHNFVPKFMQKISTINKESDNLDFLGKFQKNQQKEKKSAFELYQEKKERKKVIQQVKLKKDLSLNKGLKFMKTSKEKVLKIKSNLDQVNLIKEKIQKIRTRVDLNNSKKQPQKQFKFQSKLHENKQSINNQREKNRKSVSSMGQELPKVRLTISDFQYIQTLGQGVYGKVSLYRHSKTNFVVAIKKISKRSFDSSNQQVYLEREIKIHSLADHPNIVQMYAFFDDAEYIYLVLEVCNDGNLWSILQREGGQLPEEKAKRYMRNVSKALQFLHSSNIIHRDIKLQNILVTNGIAKLCDFGWSIKSADMRTTMCGTPLYSSPEIVKSEKYDRKVDIWCIGIMTYELIYGRPPFEIRSRDDLLKVVDTEVYFSSFIKISQECRDFIEGCLRKDPSQRFEIQDVLGHIFLRDDEKVRDSLKASMQRHERN